MRICVTVALCACLALASNNSNEDNWEENQLPTFAEKRNTIKYTTAKPSGELVSFSESNMATFLNHFVTFLRSLAHAPKAEEQDRRRNRCSRCRPPIDFVQILLVFLVCPSSLSCVDYLFVSRSRADCPSLSCKGSLFLP